MHRLFLAVGAAVALPAIASAQLLVAPEGMFVTNAGSSGLTWRTSQFTFQMIYDTTHFTNQGVVGPISIDRMRFRANGGAVSAGGTYLGDGATFGVNISIGTSVTDYAAPSTTFANNRGTMQTVMQFGTVVCAPSTGTTPNDYVIDIPIPGGFVYDPTLGQDLLVEVDAPTPSPTTIPTMATGSSQTTHRSVRISSATQGAATGTTSGFASVILFDISGGPGGIPVVAAGAAQSYGNGCYNNISRSFAELFPTSEPSLDLGAGITMNPDVPGAPTTYVVTPGAGAFVAPTGTPLLSNAATPGALGDDTMSQALNLTSFTFPFSGGSTSVLHANSNGYITLGATTQTGGDFSPSLNDMVGVTAGTHSALPRLFPCWYDLHASRNASVNPAAGLYFEEDTVNQTATITWLDVGELATSTAGAKSFNFQVVISANGTVEYRYGAMSPFGSTSQPKIVGYCPQTPGLAPAVQDLSVEMPFQTNAVEIARTPLALAATPRPILGGTTTVTTSNVPASGFVVTFFSTTQINPGVDLGVIGMPGCSALVDIGNSIGFLLTGTPTADFVLNVPNTATLVGAQLFAQSGANDPSMPNAFGAIVSNGVALTVGTVN